MFGNSDLTTTIHGWQSPGPRLGPSVAAEPGFDPHYGCSKVTVSQHSVLHLVSCCQTNNSVLVPNQE